MQANVEKREYTYCMVRFSNSQFELSYRTDDESIQAGDFVKVPFGNRNIERTGLVMRVLKCTEEDTPYPPKKTKYVLGKTEKPETWDVPRKKPAEATREHTKASESKVETERVHAKASEAQAAFSDRNTDSPQGIIENKNPKKSIFAVFGSIAFVLALTVTITFGVVKLNMGDVDEQASSQVATGTQTTQQGDSETENLLSEAELKKLYSGKLPEEGMPMRAIKYSKLGEPDELGYCRDYEKMNKYHKQITVRWYDEDGQLLASGLCFQLRKDAEMKLYSFSYLADNNVESSDDSSGKKTPWEGVRDEYDDPEELWEDNSDDFDDEDEAWDEWYDDGDEQYMGD